MTFRQMLAAQESEMAQFDDFDFAMEAEGTLTNTAARSDAASKGQEKKETEDETNIQGYVDTVNDIKDTLEKTFERIQANTSQFLKKTLVTNTEFIDTITDQGNGYVLQDKIEVVNWAYGHNPWTYLYSKLNKLRSAITNNAQYLSNPESMPDDAAIKLSGTKLDERLLQEMGAATSVTTPREYMEFTRVQFRGRKGAMEINGTEANNMITELRTFGKIETQFQNHISLCPRVTATAVSSVLSIVRKMDALPEQKKSAIKYLRNYARMITFYANVTAFMYRLHTELELNYRAVLRRLYQK